LDEYIRMAIQGTLFDCRCMRVGVPRYFLTVHGYPLIGPTDAFQRQWTAFRAPTVARAAKRIRRTRGTN